MWYKNIAGRYFGLVTKHACDRQLDGQNYDSQDCASIAALCGKNGNSNFSAANAVNKLCSTMTNASTQLKCRVSYAYLLL